MPTATDQRRLRDGARALEVSAQAGDTLTQVREQLEVVHAGIAAMQSLDDLGPELNERAYRDEEELWKRMKALEARLKQLEGLEEKKEG